MRRIAKAAIVIAMLFGLGTTAKPAAAYHDVLYVSATWGGDVVPDSYGFDPSVTPQHIGCLGLARDYDENGDLLTRWIDYGYPPRSGTSFGSYAWCGDAARLANGGLYGGHQQMAFVNLG